MNSGLKTVNKKVQRGKSDITSNTIVNSIIWNNMACYQGWVPVKNYQKDDKNKTQESQEAGG